MIKFNGNEIPHTYFNEDNIVLDIQSSYPISVFADKLRKHELNDDDYSITAFTNNNGASVYYHSLAEQNMSDNGPSFTHLFDGEVEEGLNDIESEGRNIAFVKYESYQFGNTTPECAVIEDFSINPDNPKYADNYKILYDNVMDALGIMPTLANMEDADNYSINDLIKDSQDGNHLYWAFEYIGDTNKIPSMKKDIYASLDSDEPFPQDYVKILVGGDKKNTGSLIENIKTLSLESQRYILENKPDAVQYIKNVNSDIALEVLKKTPNKIKDMSDVTYEQAEAVLGINGLLLEFVTEKPSWQNFTKEQKDLLVSCAITQNPYAIKRMKDPDPKWVSMAIFKKKDIIISYPKVSEYIWVSVLKTYPHMIKYAINPTYKMQATAIRKNPYVLNEIKNPDTKIIHEAIGLCGSLILNPKYKPYIDNNTRKAAIKNNPFVADKLDDISTDEKKIVNRINSYKDEEFEVNDLNDMSLELA